jgi:hypothetical protein
MTAERRTSVFPRVELSNIGTQTTNRVQPLNHTSITYHRQHAQNESRGEAGATSKMYLPRVAVRCGGTARSCGDPSYASSVDEESPNG